MKKKINVDRETISGEEIASRMDFNQLLSNFPGFIKPPFYKTGWFITTVASVTLLVGVTTALLLSKESNEIAATEINEQSPPPVEFMEAPISYEEDTPCINPPNKQLDVPYTSYTVQAADGGEINHNGSTIKIPKNAFTDDNGNTLSGEIELRYREFHDAADFLVSGIPMTYDSAGNEYTFESAGMIEIYGYQNNRPVSIATGKNIRVELPVKDASDRFNLYELDTTAQKWEYKGKPELTENKVDESTGQMVANNETVIQLENSFTLNPEEIGLKQQVTETKKELDQAVQAVKEHEKNVPEKPKSSQNKDRQFQLDVDPNEFPELKSYQSLSFEVDQNDKSFSDEVYTIEWEDVSLKEKEKGKSYYMTLFKGAASRTYLVHPVFEGENMKKAMAEFNKSFAVYSKELDNRKQKEKVLSEKYEKQLAIWEKAKLEAEKRNMQAAAQNKIDMENWQALQKNNQVRDMAARAFNVTQFGTWNCDSPIPKPSGITLAALFTDKNGKDLNLKHVNLIEKNKNAVFTYDRSQFGKFKFNPKEENTLVAFVEDNKMAIFQANEFVEVSSKKSHTFNMQVIDVKSLTLADVKKILKL